MWFGDNKRVTLREDLTRYHPHLAVGSTGTLLGRVKVGFARPDPLTRMHFAIMHDIGGGPSPYRAEKVKRVAQPILAL